MQALLCTSAKPLARNPALSFSTTSLLLDRDFSANTGMQDCNIGLEARFKPRQTSICKYENDVLLEIKSSHARRMHRLLETGMLRARFKIKSILQIVQGYS